jgi:cyclic pyranopterin phosphate synthase
LASSKEAVGVRSVPVVRQLRLSVTDLCNFRCCYCMPPEGVVKVAHEDLLPLEALAGMVDWLSSHTEISRVRLTGGEPLVRRGISDLIAELAAFPAIKEISLTTNASLLSRMAPSLKAAGLNRVNISLDSLDKERFALITRGGNLRRTLDGIKAAQDAGLTPIKLNAVLQRSTWKDEVPSLLDYAAANNFEIRFIELMRMGTGREWCESEFISVDEVRDGLGAKVTTVDEGSHAPAQRTLVNWRGGIVTAGWITPRSHPFCSSCERLRMDARGQLRRCLMDAAMLDLPRVLGSLDGQSAVQEFNDYLAGKHPPVAMDSPFAMSQVGG